MIPIYYGKKSSFIVFSFEGSCIIIVIEANDQTSWTCSTAQKCALTLEQNFNESTSQKNDSYGIDFFF